MRNGSLQEDWSPPSRRSVCCWRPARSAAAHRRASCLQARAGRCSTRARASRSSSSPPTCRSRGRPRSSWRWGRAIRFVLRSSSTSRPGSTRSATRSATTRPPRAGRQVGFGQVLGERDGPTPADKSVIGVIGTFNSGCSKLMVPILNRAPGGAVGMISSANTNVGLTHYAPWNDAGEPEIYYPTGKRNYVRVAATDDYQGPAAADMLKQLTKVKSVFIVHDNQTFGKGVAEAFQARAKEARHQGARLRALGCEGDRLHGPRSADQGLGCAVRLPRRHRLQQRRQAAQGPPRRARARGRCSSGPTAGRRTRPPWRRARRRRACTSATRACRSRARPDGQDVHGRLKEYDQDHGQGPSRTRSIRRRPRRSCSAQSRARTARAPR